MLRAKARRRTGAVAGLLLLGATLVGCDSKDAGPAAKEPTLSGSITVFAAASLTGSFTDLGKQFESDHPGSTVRFNFGASSALAQQILQGAPADVFASASEKNMAQVTAGDTAIKTTTFATNSAAVAVSRDSAAKVNRLEDLARPGLKIALCQPEVPCGVLAETVLAKAGVTVKPATRGLDVKSTLAYVLSGEADAAIVYESDVLAAGDKVKSVKIPATSNARTAYPMAVMPKSRNLALAQAFVAFLLSPKGRSALTQAGFGTP